MVGSRYSSFSRLLPGEVPDLESLTLRIRDGSSTMSYTEYSRLDEFLQSVGALLAFTAYDLSKDILHLVVSRHGSHLRRLRFRQTHFNLAPGLTRLTRFFFTFEELKSLAAALPRLQRLGIDLRFKGHLSYDILSGAACFPSLEHLELNTNQPFGEETINGSSIPKSDSWLNRAVAEEAFRYVAGEKLYYERVARPKTARWPPFTALDIKVGEWEPLVKAYDGPSTLPYCSSEMYSCRWVSCHPRKVDTVRLDYLVERKYYIEDGWYEQALTRAGLWSVSKLLAGPGSL